MIEELLVIGIAIGMWISGFLIAWGSRGIIESKLNKHLKGYRSFYERHDAKRSKNE